MTRRRDLTPSERQAWLRVRRTTRPLHPNPPELTADALPEPSIEDQQPLKKPVRTPEPRKRKTATAEEMARLVADSPFRRQAKSVSAGSKSKPGTAYQPVDRRGEKRIRRGRVAVETVIDLHGHTQVTALSALIEFFSRNRLNGEKSVLVITGKGRNGTGILRARFLEWLGREDIREHVTGYSTAHRKHGGDGAFYVFLRRLD